MEVLLKSKKILKVIGEVLYPSVCVLCGEVLKYGDQRGICSTCEGDYPYLQERLCSFCGKPLIDLSNDLCHDCQKQTHFFAEGRSMWTYEDLVKDAIHAYKYKNHKENGHLFAKELIRYYNGIKQWDIDLVLAVPLHPKRMKVRGFNQARLIAKAFAKANGYAIGDVDILRRVKDTQPQKDLTDKQRLKNIERAFECHGSKLVDKKVLLVDDIYTTGSTIDGCAQALLRAGANKVYFMTIAIGRGL